MHHHLSRTEKRKKGAYRLRQRCTMSLFQHKNSAWNNVSPFTSIPKGWFPVVPSTKSVECNFNEFYRTQIQMHELPCVLSLVLTGHKTQGLTTDSIILACLAPKDKSGVSGWLYVILSRVKTIEGLFLMENIEKKSGQIRRKIWRSARNASFASHQPSNGPTFTINSSAPSLIDATSLL